MKCVLKLGKDVVKKVEFAAKFVVVFKAFAFVRSRRVRRGLILDDDIDVLGDVVSVYVLNIVVLEMYV